MTHPHDTLTVYAWIGNDQPPLPALRWDAYRGRFLTLIRHHALHVYAEWETTAEAPTRSACVSFEVGADSAGILRHDLTSLAGEYEQPHVVWAHAKTRLLAPATE